jgi:hypothetical protein
LLNNRAMYASPVRQMLEDTLPQELVKQLNAPEERL